MTDEEWAACMRRAMAVRAATPEREVAGCGTATRYKRGCRCDACTRAHAVYKREGRAIARTRQWEQLAALRETVEAQCGGASGELLDLIEEQLTDMRRGDYAPKWEVSLDAPLASGTSSLHERVGRERRYLMEWDDPTFEGAAS